MSDVLKVVVLGCGPAGLMAAHAAAMVDADIKILSMPRKSFMKGAQYLHKPIPMATPPDSTFCVRYMLEGTPEDYRKKVYGADWSGTVSPEDLAEDHLAWDIRETYDWLWSTYGDYVTPLDLREVSVKSLMAMSRMQEADIVISTVPAPLLCHEKDKHAYGYTNIWSSDRPMRQVPDNTVVCNGTTGVGWYRYAMIQGHHTVEWPGHGPKPPITPMWEVTKPLKTNCTCFPDIYRMGRYGRWAKGVLSHSAFYETAALLAGTTQQPALF